MASSVDLKTYLMPPKKKTKTAGENADEEPAVAIHQLEDIVADILGWLHMKEIMQKRRVCKKWKEAVKKTIVPPSLFVVDSVARYNAMNVMTEAMPNLQQIKIGHLGSRHKYSDGEDPDEWVAAFLAHRTTHDIEIISNFSKLRILELYHGEGLNGRYPVFFNFPLLRKLSIRNCSIVKWDLGMLPRLPLLKELECDSNRCVTGNINSLRVLKDTLESVRLRNCPGVEGNLMDLADFPNLKKLDLDGTAVTGDIRDIGENDFSSLEYLRLPKGVYGGNEYELQRISDAPDLIRSVYLFNKQRPNVFDMKFWYARLSEDSPDWYESLDDYQPPFYVQFVKVGSRVGYRWEAGYENNFCDVNWLDPEPERESNDYGQYIEEIQRISQAELYSGYHQPPTEEEYQRLCEERG